ncbi:hypothetical protein EVAR_39342_1 [Eumeta japonica]|uniref:Uncharacterized protein n=1 Tax=Eumeta variegata TaxID=151549 RepID=A0A4C1WRQ4_EUMVA|nr:hypothetical protein EVAR_39342_1 [Eumeta japonica]
MRLNYEKGQPCNESAEGARAQTYNVSEGHLCREELRGRSLTNYPKDLILDHAVGSYLRSVLGSNLNPTLHFDPGLAFTSDLNLDYDLISDRAPGFE